MSGDTIASVNYFSYSTDGCPAWLISFGRSVTVRSNFVQTPVQVTMRDLRGKVDSVNLDTNALEVVKYKSSIQEVFEKDSEAQKTCYEEITDLVKKRLGASRVLTYSHSFRFRGPPAPDDKIDEIHRNPVFYPHVDKDRFGVYEEMERQLGSVEAEKLKKNRIQMINVWRPLGPNPITKNPLAICDYRSVDIDKDVQPLTIRRLDFDITAYTMAANANNAHIWYYLNKMRSDEIFLFKTFDSKPGVAQFAFHTAFEIDSEPIPTDEQRSIELRCLVFYDD